jgi:hypothetical protein
MAADRGPSGRLPLLHPRGRGVQPEKAVACAERLASLMPGAGHLVHMPAHIYIRVGRWADAITANEHAVHSDESVHRRPGSERCVSGRVLPAQLPLPVVRGDHGRPGRAGDPGGAGRRGHVCRSRSRRQVPPVEPLVPYLHLTLLTFGRWDEVLSEPQPPADLRFATAMSQYARGVAYAAKGDVGQARSALDTVRAILAATEDELSRAVLDIAHHALEGEIAFRAGELRCGRGSLPAGPVDRGRSALHGAAALVLPGPAFAGRGSAGAGPGRRGAASLPSRTWRGSRRTRGHWPGCSRACGRRAARRTRTHSIRASRRSAATYS